MSQEQLVFKASDFAALSLRRDARALFLFPRVAPQPVLALREGLTATFSHARFRTLTTNPGSNVTHAGKARPCITVELTKDQEVAAVKGHDLKLHWASIHTVDAEKPTARIIHHFSNHFPSTQWTKALIVANRRSGAFPRLVPTNIMLVISKMKARVHDLLNSLACEAAQLGSPTSLTGGGRFSSRIAVQVIDYLGIHPEDSGPVLAQLHAELLEWIEHGTIRLAHANIHFDGSTAVLQPTTETTMHEVSDPILP